MLKDTTKRYYRNKSKIGNIDEDSLWVIDKAFLRLVDDDEDILVPIEALNEYFYREMNIDEIKNKAL